MYCGARSFFPSLLERRRVDQSLFAVIMEAAWDLEVSRICADLDAEVALFRDRSLAGTPYVFLDATRVSHFHHG